MVIPTYNRGSLIAETVARVLRSDARGLPRVEVLVVDDGSTTPAEEWLRDLQPEPPFSLRTLRQRNSGPARARNLGFAASSGDIVLFLDDDVLTEPGLLWAHVAAHDLHPASVVCGRCPWKPPGRAGALFRLLGRLGHDAAEGRAEDFLPITVVASGQISVERAGFATENAVYRDDLVTPAAEEFELSMRLRRRGIPVLLAKRISALHDSPISLSALCRQQYKHGVGCAEAARRSEAALEPPRAGHHHRGELGSPWGWSRHRLAQGRQAPLDRQLGPRALARLGARHGGSRPRVGRCEPFLPVRDRSLLYRWGTRRMGPIRAPRARRQESVAYLALVLLGEGQHPQDATHPGFAFAVEDALTALADMGPGRARPLQ